MICNQSLVEAMMAQFIYQEEAGIDMTKLSKSNLRTIKGMLHKGVIHRPGLGGG